MFTRTHPLPDGPRVRLRLARAADRSAILALLRRRDTDPSKLEVGRLLRFDPARRTVLAAFAPIDGVETLIGIAGIDHRPRAEVDVFVADERWWMEVAALLIRALELRKRSATRRVA